MGKVSTAACAALLAATLALAWAAAVLMWVVPAWEATGVVVPEELSGVIRSFSTYEEMEEFLRSRVEVPPAYVAVHWYRGGVPEVPLAVPASAKEVPSYSKTNVQVEGVDEADVVKTDGTYIYLASGGSIYILRAYPPEEAAVLSKIELGSEVSGIFVVGDRLVAFSTEEGGSGWETVFRVYDVSDRGAPELKRKFSVSGWYFTSRAVGDFVYTVLTSPAVRVLDAEPVRLDVVVPVVEMDDVMRKLDPSQIFYFPESNETAYELTTIVAFNVKADGEGPVVASFLLGKANNLYMSLSNLYITAPKREAAPIELAGAPPGVTLVRPWYQKTVIHRFSVQGLRIAYEASGEVPGKVLNQFSMDEYNGFFRVATTRWEGKPTNDVYVLNMDMEVVGAVTGLAPGEWIRSARFVSDMCYLVTFKKTDPLFVIDLSEPAEPRVLGWLKIPGYSNYLHPYDETHLIGVGKETVEAERGDFAWYRGVKVSLFDVSDFESPRELDKYVIGDRGSDTPVLHDHKAFLFDGEKNLLVIPVLVAVRENPYAPPWEHGKPVWQGAYVFEVSPEAGIVLRGTITHLPEGALTGYEVRKGIYDLRGYFVKRALYIGDVLYTISDVMVKMNSLIDLSELGSLELA